MNVCDTFKVLLWMVNYSRGNTDIHVGVEMPLATITPYLFSSTLY